MFPRSTICIFFLMCLCYTYSSKVGKLTQWKHATNSICIFPRLRNATMTLRKLKLVKLTGNIGMCVTQRLKTLSAGKKKENFLYGNATQQRVNGIQKKLRVKSNSRWQKGFAQKVTWSLWSMINIRFALRSTLTHKDITNDYALVQILLCH